VISGVTVPVHGAIAVTKITATEQFTGTVSWRPSHATFAAETGYTATITLTARPGYTLEGVPDNFFTVAGATSVSNSADSGVLTAAFPATAAAAAKESGFTEAITVASQGTITVGSVTAKMIYANDQPSIKFPCSVNYEDTGDSFRTLKTKFFMSETEVTNEPMAEVLQWAVDNGKIVEAPGEHNEVSPTTVRYGTQELLDLDNSDIKIHYLTGSFTVDFGFTNHPVVCVSWYGAIMFCNWLTEMRDGNTLNVVYTGICTTWDHGDTDDDDAKTGYRLPSYEEWEFAARYLGTDPEGRTDYVSKGENGGSLYLTEGYYWTPAKYASGGSPNFMLNTIGFRFARTQ
jgi:formylglycine-generating enzyme required for sulfatase activity